MKPRLLIIGGGLAGSVLGAKWVQEHGYACVIDDGALDAATRVSAGLISPITGQRWTVSPYFQQLWANSRSYYESLNQDSTDSCFIPYTMCRFFRSSSDETRIKQLIESGILPDNQVSFFTSEAWSQSGSLWSNKFGGVLLKQSARCQQDLILQLCRKHILTQGAWQEGQVAFDEIKLNDDGVVYQGECFDWVVLAMGRKILDQALFQFLPLSAVKGQIITWQGDQDHSYIIVGEKWSLPLGQGLWMSGATFERDKRDTIITDAGRAQIEHAIRQNYQGPMKIIQQHAGVRVATPDQMPVIGFHPQFKRLGLISALGSKGFLWAPFLADQMIRAMRHQEDISPEVNIRRFISKKP